MKIEKIIVEGFRSFGMRQEISLNDLTSVVGGNGVGKTSFLIALNRFFGMTQKDRQVINEDFYLPGGQQLDDVPERKFLIEVKAVFPELRANEANQNAVAECFRNMTIDPGPNELPYVRMRLESTYTRDQYGEGEIKTETFWIKDSYIEEITEEEKKSFLSPHDRQKIRVIYTPASRSPDVQLKEFSGSLIGNFIKSINWVTSPENTLREAVTTVKGVLNQETGVKVINDAVSKRWSNLTNSSRYSQPNLSFIDDDVKKLLKDVSMNFQTQGANQQSEIENLSDGEKSLFYFSLLHSSLSLKDAFLEDQEIVINEQRHRIKQSFDEEKLQFPSLTLLAIEEPENHLSPHHFGHLIESFRGIAKSSNSQVVFSSHSPSIISRIAPEDIRYFRQDGNVSIAKKLTLPDSRSDSFTYVKEAVRSYPELYFSKIIVLGEGDSEEVILKRLFEVKGLPLDRSMISVVPLGGRFVNHFWKLLNDLNIPYVTLLDLDIGKEGGGWGRIKYAIQQIVDLGVSFDVVVNSSITQQQHEQMHTWTISNQQEYDNLHAWVNYLQSQFSIFFSKDLDIDMMMIDKFLNKYIATIQAPQVGPRLLPVQTDPNYQTKLDEILNAIFNSAIIPIAYDPTKLSYYRYFFLGKGKPLTHNLALSSLTAEELLRDCPEVLIQLSDAVARKLNPEVVGQLP